MFSTKKVDPAARDQALDIFGFRKMIVSLTNFGKIISFSSLDGRILWTSRYHEDAPMQILLRKNYLREEGHTETQVVSCFSNHVEFSSSANGQLLYSQPLNITANKFLIKKVQFSESQVLLAIGKDSKGQTKVEAYPKDIIPKDGFANEFAHFSEIRGTGFKTLAEGQKVSFEVKRGPKGLQASNITPQ